MDYREFQSRYFDNLGLDDTDSTQYRKCRQDYSDALVDIYSESAPRKTFREQVIETKPLVEDFADTTYITGFSIVSGLTQGADRLDVDGGGVGVCTVSDLDNIGNITVTVGGNSVAITPTACTILITDQLGNTLIDTTLNEELGGGVFSHDFEFSMAQSMPHMILTITISKVGGFIDFYLDSISILQDYNRILLPTDFFLPLEVIFDKTTERDILYSNEMHRERFDRWIPGKLSSPSGEITTEGSIDTVFATEENAEFDRSIGYSFDFQPTNTYLLMKPVFAGVVTVVYAYMPIPVADDNNPIQFHRAFVDVLLYNATIRGIRKLLMEKNISEPRYLSLTIALKEYKQQYPFKLNSFTNFMKAKAEPVLIKPFSFMNDPDMLLD